MYEVQIIILNSFGEFLGRKTILSEEDYLNLLKMAKGFHTGGSFDLTCEDGNYMVFAPGIVQQSILRINKKIIEKN
jgi:hypothetical protein